MKTIQSILLTLISIFTLAQSYCPPNGITTNPNNPINQQNPGYLNHFNWATTSSVYNYNTSCMPNTYTTNPFLSNQSELLSIINNNKPENGWEVIAYNLGYDNNNQPLQAKPDHAFLMLYNKYTGILRVLVKWCRASNYNGSVLTLKFSQGFQTNLLDMANGEKPLLANHIPNPSITTAIRFYNDYSSWGYADFKLNYDPCTCSFNDMSRIQLYTELIKNSSIQMSGTINGSITSVVDGQGTVNSQGNFWKSATNITSKATTASKDVQSFMNNYNNIYKNLSDNGVTINAIKSLGDAMNKSDFLKAGLKAIPYVGDAVKFISALFGGGASSSGPVILAPLTVDLSIGLTGTITTQDPMHNQTIGLPGSQQASILAGTYGNSPLYNETLGIFSLIDIPKMYYTESVASKSYTNYTRDGALGEQAHKDIRNYDLKYRNYKLDGNSFRYAINPASKLIIQDAQIMLIANYEKPSLLYSKKEGYSIYNLDTDSNNGLPIQFSNSLSIPIEYRKTNIGNLIDEDKSIFQNSFPIIGDTYFKNSYSFSFLYEVNVTKLNSSTYNAYPFSSSCVSFSNPNLLVAYSSIDKIPFSQSISTCALGINYYSFYTNSTKRSPIDDFLLPRVKSFGLKLILNLKRIDDTTAPNILYVVTYPIELVPAPQGYNMSGDDYALDAQNYANGSGTIANKFRPITQSELSTVCLSAVYKNNRVQSSYRMINDTSAIKETTNKDIELYPNPIKDILT